MIKNFKIILLSVLVFLSFTNSSFVETTVSSEVEFVFIISFVIWLIMKNTMSIMLNRKWKKLGTDVTETSVITYAIRD